MNKIYRTLLLLLLPVCSFAQSHTLTLSECREMALESNHDLRSSSHKILAAEDILAAYRAAHTPNFSLSGGYLYSTTTFNETITGGYLPTFSPNPTTGEMTPNIASYAADGTPIFSSYAYMPDMNFDFKVGSLFGASLKATQPIYMGRKISTAVKLAQVGVDVANIERSRTKADVTLSTDEAFYTYIKVQDMLRSAESYYTVIESLCNKTESMLKNGVCTRSDLLKVQTMLSEAELQRLKAKNGVTLSRMNLCYAIGLPLTTNSLEIVDDVSPDNSHIDMSLDITARPEYALIEKSIEAKRLEADITAASLKPSLTAMASYGYANGLKINSQTLLGSASFTGGVVLNVPIFHGGEARRKLSAAKREISIAQSSQANLTERMTLELASVINAYVEAQARVELMQRSVIRAEECLRQSERQYAAGMQTLTETLESSAMWQKAMSDLTEAKGALRIAYARYERCKGER